MVFNFGIKKTKVNVIEEDNVDDLMVTFPGYIKECDEEFTLSIHEWLMRSLFI